VASSEQVEKFNYGVENFYLGVTRSGKAILRSPSSIRLFPTQLLPSSSGRRARTFHSSTNSGSAEIMQEFAMWDDGVTDQSTGCRLAGLGSVLGSLARTNQRLATAMVAATPSNDARSSVCRE
jgi:hypothetical protein